MGLLSVLPGGEAFIVMLGMVRANWVWTTVAMIVGKAARYSLIVLSLAGIEMVL